MKRKTFFLKTPKQSAFWNKKRIFFWEEMWRERERIVKYLLKTIKYFIYRFNLFIFANTII